MAHSGSGTRCVRCSRPPKSSGAGFISRLMFLPRCRNQRTRRRWRRSRRSTTPRISTRPSSRSKPSRSTSGPSILKRSPRSPTIWTPCWSSTTTRPNIGFTYAPRIRSKAPSPQCVCAPRSPKARDHARPDWLWPTSSSTPPRPAGAPSTPHTWSLWSAPARSSTRESCSNAPPRSPQHSRPPTAPNNPERRSPEQPDPQVLTISLRPGRCRRPPNGQVRRKAPRPVRRRVTPEDRQLQPTTEAPALLALRVWLDPSSQSAVEHGGRAQLLGHPERVDEGLGVRAQLAAAVVDPAGDRLGPLGGQIPVLDVPGLVVLDDAESVEVTDPLEDLAGRLVGARVDAGDERLEHDPVDVGRRRVQHVILHGVERVELRHLLGLGLQSARHRRQQILLAVFEHVHLGAPVEQAALLVAVLARIQDRLHDRLGRSTFEHPLADGLGGEAHPRSEEHTSE